jgi:choline dehydrogenase-like flavoprotein
VLPTSGQANPTMTAVQLGLRLADHLAARRGASPPAARESPAVPARLSGSTARVPSVPPSA